MKSKWMLLGALAACIWAIPAVAQDPPKVEITGEYSYLRFNPSLPALQNRNFNGGGFDASYFLRPMTRPGSAEFVAIRFPCASRTVRKRSLVRPVIWFR